MPVSAINHNVREATRVLDSVDRWKIAERFGVDHVHDCTRSELFRAIERGSGRGNFQDIMSEMEAMTGVEERNADTLPLMNFGAFMSDDPQGRRLDASDGVLAPFAHTTRWLHDVIGNACPFVRPSLGRQRIWTTAARRSESTGENLYQLLRKARTTLLELGLPQEDRENGLNALVVLFPDFPSNRSPLRVMEDMRGDGDFTSGDGVTAAPFYPSLNANQRHESAKRTPTVVAFRHEFRR